MPDQPPISESHADFNAEAASSAIARLRVLLESCDGDAAEAFLAVQKSLAGIIATSQLDALYTTINEFDFETALIKLEELAESAAEMPARG